MIWDLDTLSLDIGIGLDARAELPLLYDALQFPERAKRERFSSPSLSKLRNYTTRKVHVSVKAYKEATTIVGEVR